MCARFFKLVLQNQSLWWGKLGHQVAIFWLKKELSIIHGTLNIFFRNKTFLFVKIEIWNFQHLFDLLFRETCHNFSLFGQLLFPLENVIWMFVWMSWNFEDFTKFYFKQLLKILAFYLDKQKSFIPKKNMKCTMDSSFFSQKMPYCLLTLLVYIALCKITQKTCQIATNIIFISAIINSRIFENVWKYRNIYLL